MWEKKKGKKIIFFEKPKLLLASFMWFWRCLVGCKYISALVNDIISNTVHQILLDCALDDCMLLTIDWQLHGYSKNSLDTIL